MFLSRRNGIYYLWYTDEAGRKQKVSTRVSSKSEAVKFLRDFRLKSKKTDLCISELFGEIVHQGGATIFRQPPLASSHQRILRTHLPVCPLDRSS